MQDQKQEAALNRMVVVAAERVVVGAEEPAVSLASASVADVVDDVAAA